MQCLFQKLSLATLAFGIGCSLQAAPYLEDAITNAAPGSNLGSAAPWGTSASQVKVAAGNLTHPTLLPLTPAGNMINILGTSGASSYRSFNSAAIASGSVYYSLLVRCVSLPSGSGYLTGLLPPGDTSPGGSQDSLAVYFELVGNGYRLGIRKQDVSAVYATPQLAAATTHFLVAKYTFGSGTGDDVVRLYINPAPGGAEPTTPDATQTGGTDAASLQNVYIKSSNGYGSWCFDTLRIGPTWASVTPAEGAEPPSAQPRVTQTLISAGAVVLRGTNGTPDGVYRVLSSTNLLQPLADWPLLATNRFASNGDFDCTNAVTELTPRFYRLLLGGEMPEPPLAPAIVTQPADLIAAIGQDATFNVVATGTPPLRYQWYFNTNTLLADSTNAPLTVPNAQTNNAGGYFVIVTNSAGAATSALATLQVIPPPPANQHNFDLAGFAATTTGGGVLPDTDADYRMVYTPDEFRLALAADSLKVIEIMNDLDLGWNEIPPAARTGAFRQNTPPSLHPALIASGVTLIDIQDKDGLTIFSAHGATIRHAEFNVKRCNNLIIRNLRFDELWEWDELTAGDYDAKDWDFMTIDMSSTNVWVDHCDFTKAYDGVVDIKGGSRNVTVSWCRFLADEGAANSFVRQQIDALEQNSPNYPIYDFLRTRGFSLEDIIAVTRSQKKGHLVGATEFQSQNTNLSVTLHHNYYRNFQDRLPRLRGGNAHVFNVYLDNTEALAAKRLRDARVAAMSPSDALKLSNGTYSFNVTLNAAISTEDGAVLVEKSHLVDTLYPIRNNQTDPGDPDYTGKIRALDTLYTLDRATFRGGSEDAGSPLAPVPAPPKPFGWNGHTSLPYSYTLDDPTLLAATLTGTNGPGSGVITWAKTNWLRTSY